MRTPKLITSYRTLSDANLKQLALNVKTMLTGNAYFKTTKPSLEDFSKLLENFDQALAKSASRDRILIALKNEAKEALLLSLRQLALDIDAQANGNKAMLVSSGFQLSASGDNPGTISTPTDFRILDGVNPGELRFMCKKVTNAVSYLFQYTSAIPTDTTSWNTLTNSSKELLIRGLSSNERIYGRIIAVGRKGQQAISEVLSRIVQ